MTDPEEEVRRRLADARHTEPMPEDVAGRLSERLSELPMPSASGELAAVRRRRAATLLVAAAAVVVAGIGAGALFGPDLSGEDTAGTAASDPVEEGTEPTSTEGDAAEGEESAPESPEADQRADGLAEDELSATLDAPEGADRNRMTVVRLTVVDVEDPAPVRLRRDGLADRVRRVARRVENAPSAGVLDPAETADLLASHGCEQAGFGDGHLVPARYAGQPAVLALRPPVGGTRIAEVLPCGSTEPLRSLTVPVD